MISRGSSYLRLICAVLALISFAAAADERRRFTVLAVNDVYRIDGIKNGTLGGLDRLRTLRAELEAKDPGMITLHAGDFLFPSLLSRQFNGLQMIDVMNLLDGLENTFDSRLFVTFGNHEFDKAKLKDAALIQEAIEQSQFTWLSSNVHFKRADSNKLLVEHRHLLPNTLIVVNGVRVGIMALTIGNALPAYVDNIADPIGTAREVSRSLRQRGAEIVIAITHLSIEQDRRLLAELGAEGPDVIFGGHEHNRQQRQVNGRWVIKADADAVTATIATITLSDQGKIAVEYRYQQLDEQIDADAPVSDRIQYWFKRYDQLYCEQTLQLPANCLDQVIGYTLTPLVGDELQMRRFETNLGNWLADQARSQFVAQGAEIALLNSGGLRLNQTIAAGPIKRRAIEELFAYPAPMRLLRINGATLQQMLNRSVQDWTGNGHWLQVSGLAYRHNPVTGEATDLTLLSTTPARPISADEHLLVVVPDYLVNPDKDQDGYTMLNPEQVVSTNGQPTDLKQQVIQVLEAAGNIGIAPRVEGRICNSEHATDVCLALPGNAY